MLYFDFNMGKAPVWTSPVWMKGEPHPTDLQKVSGKLFLPRFKE